MVKQERITEQQNGLQNRVLQLHFAKEPLLVQYHPPSSKEVGTGLAQCKITYNILLVAWVAPLVMYVLKHPFTCNYKPLSSILECMAVASVSFLGW